MELKFVSLLKKGEIRNAKESMIKWLEIVKKEYGL
jgi:hypothetical protein